MSRLRLRGGCWGAPGTPGFGAWRCRWRRWRRWRRWLLATGCHWLAGGRRHSGHWTLGTGNGAVRSDAISYAHFAHALPLQIAARVMCYIAHSPSRLRLPLPPPLPLPLPLPLLPLRTAAAAAAAVAPVPVVAVAVVYCVLQLPSCSCMQLQPRAPRAQCRECSPWQCSPGPRSGLAPRSRAVRMALVVLGRPNKGRRFWIWRAPGRRAPLTLALETPTCSGPGKYYLQLL
jgi:hypothetical protein